MANKFIFLSSDFYLDFPAAQYPEIEQKPDRPYIYVSTLINNVQFAVPLRSNIRHGHVLWTDKQNHCGLDFSKAVVVAKPNYVDNIRDPHIRPNEFKSLKGKEYIIYSKMFSFIQKYKNAKANLNIHANQRLCRFSSLQYFEQYF